MDLLGKVVRDYLRQAEEDNLRNATSLAEELLAERMSKVQIKEMLYASGFEKRVVEATIIQLFPGGKRRSS